MKPTLRDETRIDTYTYIDGIKRIMTDPKQFPFRNCLNCCSFNTDTEICKLANQRPPAKIVCYGCEHHSDIEEIPF